MYFEAVRSEPVHMDLKYLKENNPLCCDISIDVNNIPNELTEMNSSLNDKDPCHGLEEEENSLDSYRFNSQDTMFVHATFTEEICIALG